MSHDPTTLWPSRRTPLERVNARHRRIPSIAGFGVDNLLLDDDNVDNLLIDDTTNDVLLLQDA